MFKFLIILGLLFYVTVSAQAQQTIFNVPTTDVLNRGQVYVEQDASFKTNNESVLHRFSSFVPRVVVGVGNNVEVGLNVTGNIQPGLDSTTLVPTAKWKFYEKKVTALIAGTNLYIPIRNRGYNFGSYSYLAVSRTINETRLTAAGYVASKNVFAPNAVRAGGQFGIEQTVNKKLTVAADWITGGHSAGYFTPGIFYKPNPKLTAYLGYSIGNSGASNGNHYFLFELGYNFN